MICSCRRLTNQVDCLWPDGSFLTRIRWELPFRGEMDQIWFTGNIFSLKYFHQFNFTMLSAISVRSLEFLPPHPPLSTAHRQWTVPDLLTPNLRVSWFKNPLWMTCLGNWLWKRRIGCVDWLMGHAQTAPGLSPAPTPLGFVVTSWFQTSLRSVHTH